MAAAPPMRVLAFRAPSDLLARFFRELVDPTRVLILLLLLKLRQPTLKLLFLLHHYHPEMLQQPRLCQQ